MNIYTAKQVVEKVDGLNSERTLRRWAEIASEQYGKIFNSSYMNVGRKNTRIRYVAYTDEDIHKFQMVAETKEQLGLKKAIEKAFKGNHQLTIETLDSELKEMKEGLNEKYLEQEKKVGELEKVVILLRQENYRLSKRMENLEKGLRDKGSLKNYWKEQASI